MCLIPDLGKAPGRGNGNSLQYPCLQNPTNRGAWRATVNGIVESQTRLKQLSMRALMDRETVWLQKGLFLPGYKRPSLIHPLTSRGSHLAPGAIVSC